MSEEMYEIMENGEVYSNHNWRGYGRRKITPFIDKHGYVFIRLSTGNKRLKRKIHQLVCLEFNGPRPSKFHEVRHLDGNKLNNHKDNLRWGTRKENAEDRDSHNRTSKGEKHSKLIKAGIYGNR